MTFSPNIPLPTDQLSDSQSVLRANNLALDASFGIDHYPFSNATASNGFHNKVTTPVYVANPPTGNPPVTTTNPIFYGFQDTANIGVLQYSRGPSNAVPSPVTYLQSADAGFNIAASSTVNILDFTGITKAAICTVYASFNNSSSPGNGVIEYLIYWFWNGISGSFVIRSITAPTSLAVNSSGNILQLQTGPALTEVRWAIKFHRIQLT